jgi:hypothetical protein
LFVEPPHRVEDRPLNEEVGGRAEAFLHVAALPEEPARIDELGGRRRARQLELDTAGDTRRGRQAGEPLLDPVFLRPAVDIDERQVVASRRVQTGIPRCIRTPGPRVHQEAPTGLQVLLEPCAALVPGRIVYPDDFEDVPAGDLALQGVEQDRQLREGVPERNNHR